MNSTNGTAWLRQHIFTLEDGTFVLQRDDRTVEELLTGQLRPFERWTHSGQAITDYELSQLQSAGYIVAYDDEYVKLNSRDALHTVANQETRERVYYLTTTLPAVLRGYVEQLLRRIGADEEFLALTHNGFVVILRREGRAFASAWDSDQAEQQLRQQTQHVLNRLATAFIEGEKHAIPYTVEQHDVADQTHMSKQISNANRGENSVINGKVVVLAVRQEEERQAISHLLHDLGMVIHHAQTGREAILIMEDHTCDSLILDIQLTDMHAWAMLGTLKESVDVSQLPVLVLMDEQTVLPPGNITPVVRPFSMVWLRSTLNALFKAS